MKTSAALVVAAIGVLTGAYGWLRGGSAPARGVKEAPAFAPPSNKQVVVHEHRYVSVAPTAAAGERGPAPSSPEDAQTAAAATKPPIDPEERRFQVETAFYEDQPPTVTSRTREGTIRRAFSLPTAEGSVLQSVECRASRCRLEVEFADSSADNRVIRGTLMNSDELNMGGTVAERTVTKDGRVHAVIYLFPPKTAP